MGVSLQVTVPEKKKFHHSKGSPLKSIFREKKIEKKPKKWDYYRGGVVVGLLHGGCSSPKKIPKKKSSKKFANFGGP